MIETEIDYEKQIKGLTIEIDDLRSKTEKLSAKEKDLAEMKKKANQEKLSSQNLATCSMYHPLSGLFPTPELRYFYFSYYWIRKDFSGREMTLQRLCQEHYPDKPNSVTLNCQDTNQRNITSEVVVENGRLILVVNSQDVTDIPVMETHF